MTDKKPFPPVFATNDPSTGETVAAEVNRMLAGLRTQLASPPNLALATAYINPQGFALIADEVEQAPRVRILLGAEPEQPVQRRIESGEIPSFAEIANAYVDGLKRERDLIGFDAQSDATARRLVKWLRFAEQGHPPRVEVRRFTKGFLHGKAFIAEHSKLPAVLAGSANLTHAGLIQNRELVLGYPSGNYTELVVDWFSSLWDESEPFDLAALYEARWSPHPPIVVFLRMLYELYGATPELTGAEEIKLPATEFQIDGILRAIRILNELGGVLVCDEVGLGKTFIAGELIRIVSQVGRQKVLIVVPASLKLSTWTPFLKKYDLISARVDIVSFDELRLKKKIKPEQYDDYSLIVIDEAHNLRNAGAQRSQEVMSLLAGVNPKKVMLLTATPVNNSLIDLKTLIEYFVKNDGQFTPIGIPSITDYIKHAQSLDPNTLSPEHLFDLMDKVAVRRTRHFIKKEYWNDQIRNNRGELVPIVFPTPTVKRLEYTLDDEADSLVDLVLYALDVGDEENLVIRVGKKRDPNRLSLARYASSFYTKGNNFDHAQLTNVGLLRSGLLKRLESSTAALIATFQRLILAHTAFLKGIDNGYVLIGDALSDFVANDADSFEEFFEQLDQDGLDQTKPIDLFDIDALRKDVEGDVKLLKSFLQLAIARNKRGPDAKVDRLLEQLEEIAKKASRPTKEDVSPSERRKIIVFSTYSDTVKDLHKRVTDAIKSAPKTSALAAYKDRIAPAIFGARNGDAQVDRTAVLAGFCPVTAGELSENGTPKSADEFDVMVTTDVLAEGVNLQQAGQIVNFDLPWNPMRLVQRHGRIDRIGSPHSRVGIGCFFPAANLEQFLHLEETLQRKISYANAAIGAGTVIPDQIADPKVEVVLHDKRREIMALFDENAALLADGGGSRALSGEEFRRRLSRSMRDPFLKDQILELPQGSGSGFVSSRLLQAGFVFCIKIGTHGTPWFRFIACDNSTWKPVLKQNGKPWIDADTLTCLIAADPGDNELTQVIPNEAMASVFDAWDIVRSDVHTEWTRLTDWNLHAPQIDLALREAVKLVFDHGSFLKHGEQSELLGKLNARWDNSIVRGVRQIVREEKKSNKEKIESLLEFVIKNGLQKPEYGKPLPKVNIEEIRVVSWMAVSPSAAVAADGNMAGIRPNVPMSIIEQVGELPLDDKL